MPNYHIEITSGARKEIQKLDKPTIKKFDKAIVNLQNNPFQNTTEKLTKHPDADYRYRIGNWRILFTIINDVIYIVHIWPRGKNYKK